MSQKAFQMLLNSLTVHERERVLKVATTYGLAIDDPTWVILAINQTGLMAMEKAIAELTDLHHKEIAAFQQKAQMLADVAMGKAAQESILKISDTLASTAQSLYRKGELKVTTSWTVCAAIVGITFFVGVNLLSYLYLESTVYKKAQTDAYQMAYDEKNRASWANTKIGKLAFELSQVTDIQVLALCRNPGSGWRFNVKKDVCLPLRNSDGVTYGWAIPKI